MNLIRINASIFFVITSSLFINAQSDYTVENAFNDYTILPREITYAHLNKSTYIKGESLGFTVYLLNKADKKPFKETSNLYCTISDSSNKVIKSKLIKVDNGIANSAFQIDDLFTSGDYTFKAYTNYMINFKEQNAYIQKIRVIDPDKESEIRQKSISNSKIDVQFLPEGGHLVANIPNIVGVAIKDSIGFGVPHIRGVIKTSQGETITPFSVNQFGFGKFLFKPLRSKTYYAEIDFNHRTEHYFIGEIREKGINMQLLDLEDKVALTYTTNNKTLAEIRDKSFKVIIHNGDNIKEVPLKFSKENKVIKAVNRNDLFSGINIFTLFDDKNHPISERLYFNYDGIHMIKSDTYSSSIKNDSIHISLNLKAIDSERPNNISISVLPRDTRTYNHHHNILSQVYLQPYVKGFIENANYYFKEVNPHKKFELDNLLLTQGWSSYDWEDIFNSPPKETYTFETGVSIKALVNKQREQRFLVHSINHRPPDVLSITKNDKGFYVTSTYLRDKDTLKISRLQAGGGLVHSNLNLEFSPNKIPDFKNSSSCLGYKDYELIYSIKPKAFSIIDLGNTQLLDEVLVSGKKNEARNTKIIGKAQGSVDFFNEDGNDFPEFRSYIQARGFILDPNKGLINASTGEKPAIYINGDRVWVTSVQMQELYTLPLDRFDYVITNRHKTDFPEFGSTRIIRGGVIRIKMRDTKYLLKDTRKRFTSYKAPLTFDTKKTFYVPKYQTYQDSYFKQFGVIDWLPINHINKDGTLSFKVYNNNITGVKLFIEGIANDGSFISEVKTINIEPHK